MTSIELANLVADMRRAQRKYFRTRSSGDLEESKRLEKKVDSEVDMILRQPMLFGDMQ